MNLATKLLLLFSSLNVKSVPPIGSNFIITEIGNDQVISEVGDNLVTEA